MIEIPMLGMEIKNRNNKNRKNKLNEYKDK